MGTVAAIALGTSGVLVAVVILILAGAPTGPGCARGGEGIGGRVED